MCFTLIVWRCLWVDGEPNRHRDGRLSHFGHAKISDYPTPATYRKLLGEATCSSRIVDETIV